jgi:hypothetical protein
VNSYQHFLSQHDWIIADHHAQAWRQERVDTAEHMYTKCKQLTSALTPKSAETLADLLYEIGKDSFEKRNYEAAIRWLERAYDTLGEQDMELLSPEASELRLSTMHSIGMHPVRRAVANLTLHLVQARMKINTSEERDKAWQIMKLMETVSAVVAVLQARILMQDRIIPTKW